MYIDTYVYIYIAAGRTGQSQTTLPLPCSVTLGAPFGGTERPPSCRRGGAVAAMALIAVSKVTPPSRVGSCVLTVRRFKYFNYHNASGIM